MAISAGVVRDWVMTGPAAEARRKRRAALASAFPDLASMRVLDLGGRADAWADNRPGSLTLVNLAAAELGAPDWVTVVVGDATDPDLLAGERFDLVFSNSVLEHVGGHTQRQRMADNVHRLGDAHWVQTPYRYFPVEPHFLFPGLQWLPLAAQVEVLRRWPLGHAGKYPNAATSVALGVELVSVTEMRHYFPRSRIVREWLGGFTKSLTAVSR